MLPRLLRCVLMTAAILAALIPVGAHAQDDENVTGALTATGTPFAITSCKIAKNGIFWHGIAVTLFNRTVHQLLSADVTLRFYDGENALIGQTIFRFPAEPALMSGDNGSYSLGAFGVKLSEPASAVTKIECRPTAAVFTGNKKWVFGKAWPEKLLPLPKQSSRAAVPPQTSALVAIGSISRR